MLTFCWRCIDLVLVSGSLVGFATMVTHNGVHCVTRGCTLGWCRGISCSDHFLNELVIKLPTLTGTANRVTAVRTRMPKGLQCVDEWRRVLLPLAPLADVLSSLLAPAQGDWVRRRDNLRKRQAEVDAVASCISMFFMLAITLWCAWPKKKAKTSKIASKKRSLKEGFEKFSKTLTEEDFDTFVKIKNDLIENDEQTADEDGFKMKGYAKILHNDTSPLILFVFHE